MGDNESNRRIAHIVKRESIPPYNPANPVLASVLALFPEEEITGMFGPDAMRKIRQIMNY